MPIITPDFFRHQDLNIDVRLEASVNGSTYDLTGRKYLSVGLLKDVNTSKNFTDSIGFGITDINIVVNTSLQPLVEITFKDLYGNTTMGPNNSRGIDYSILFSWPPPKFLLTFKGYFGGPVTWVLNLKKYDTSRNSSDGSYEIKCSFVPNQFGFFADMPFLFLLAVKKLKKDDAEVSKSEDPNQRNESQQTIFDIMLTGKQVEVKNFETSKKFDFLLKQVTSLRNNMSAALVQTKLISFDETVSGVVEGVEIKDFVSFKVNSPFSFGVESEEAIVEMLADSKKLATMNAFLASKFIAADGSTTPGPVQIPLAAPKDYNNKTYQEIYSLPDEEKRKILDAANGVLDKNIQIINDEIKATQFENTRTQLRKITISEVLNQIASDSAYLMGRILQAGLEGNSGPRREIRNTNDSSLISQCYPLTIKSGEELPATQKNMSNSVDVGVEAPGCEMDFVRQFIEAVTDGIAELEQIESLDTLVSDDKLKSRINNLEILSSNPWRPNFVSFAENILTRSAIAAFFTRSNDPNQPGDYGNATNYDNDNDYKNIEILAVNDAKNISESLVASIPDEELLQLSEFATFFKKLISVDGDDFLNGAGEPDEEFNLEGQMNQRIDVASPIPDSIWNYKVVISPGSTQTNNIKTQQDVANAITNAPLNSGFKAKTLRDVLSPGIFGGNLKNIGYSSLSGYRFINNGIPYFWPNVQPLTTKGYSILVFKGEDARRLREVNSTDTDQKFKDDTSVKEIGAGAFGLPEPLGVVFVSGNKDADGDVLNSIKNFNFYVENNIAFDYDKLKEVPSNFFQPEFAQYSWEQSKDAFLWTNKITLGTQADFANGEVEPKDLAYMVFSHKYDMSNQVVFDLFSNGHGTELQSRNQRVYIRAICSEIEAKVKGVERKKQEVIGRILGKAAEQENVVYKHMHTLFQQWNTLASADFLDSNGNMQNSNPGSHKDLAGRLMREFGKGRRGKTQNIKTFTPEDSEIEDSGTFIYDYPLQRISQNNGDTEISKIIVENSIINIDPLYKPDERTTVLNMIQSICSKNSFMFIPIPGSPNFKNIKDFWKPYPGWAEPKLRSFFHVVFTPTPETRTVAPGKTYTSTLMMGDSQRNFDVDAIQVKMGSVDNHVIKNVTVGTQDNKVTAESIINLQRLVDNENQNKTVTTDCSVLNVLAGRSYKATVDCHGNAQVYPMQYFFLENMPLFDGLYWILNVKHNISPNTMSTTFDGIRMRFDSSSGYGGIKPITLEILQDLLSERRANDDTSTGDVGYEVPTESMFQDSVLEPGEVDQTQLGQGQNTPGLVIALGEVSTVEVVLLPAVQGFVNSKKLQTANGGEPIADTAGKATKREKIMNMNMFIKDVFEPWAVWLKSKYPDLYKQVGITSGIRNFAPVGGSQTSQHFYGQAIDFQIAKSKQDEKLDANYLLLNSIFEWYRLNPDKKYGQILMETNPSNQVWIHWSYQRGSGNKMQRKRMYNHKSISAPMNGFHQVAAVTKTEARMNNFNGTA